MISSPRPVSLPVAAVALGLVVWEASPAPAATPTAQEALLLKPRQPDIDCDRPTNDEAETATIKQETFDGFSALVVRTTDGRILRVFADTNGDRVTGAVRRRMFAVKGTPLCQRSTSCKRAMSAKS